MIVDVNGAPEFAFRHFPHFLTKHGRVKLNRPIKVGDRDICPAKCISAHCAFVTLQDEKAKTGYSTFT
jgi:hypothetical protein